jgi:hypothetical protein
MKPVFIHVSKNGGTSVVRSAGDHIVSAGHRTAASWVAEHGRPGPLFAVVRHPYQRVASEYAYRRRRRMAGERNPHLSNLDKPIEEWVVSTFVGDEYRTRAFFERTGEPYNPVNLVGDSLIWFVPQTRWLCDDAGDLLVDELLRFETLDRDWHRFSKAHGFECRLAHANASPGSGELADRLDRRTRGIIVNHFREDFEVFGYEP